MHIDSGVPVAAMPQLHVWMHQQRICRISKTNKPISQVNKVPQHPTSTCSLC